MKPIKRDELYLTIHIQMLSDKDFDFNVTNGYDSISWYNQIPTMEEIIEEMDR